jgi:hypothetical protein
MEKNSEGMVRAELSQ